MPSNKPPSQFHAYILLVHSTIKSTLLYYFSYLALRIHRHLRKIDHSLLIVHAFVTAKGSTLCALTS
jgi:hypothetical protein